MKTTIIKLEYIISTLIGISFCSIYILPATVTIIINITILILSYICLIKKNSFFIVVILIMSAKTINGFILNDCFLSYKVITPITTYIPLIIYFMLNIELIRKISKKTIKKNIFLIVFGVFMVMSFIVNYAISYPLLFKRIAPFISFLVFVILLNKKIFFVNTKYYVYFFRVVFISSMITYVYPNYLTKTIDLYLSGAIYGIPNEYPFSGYFGFIRNNGIFFDGRILGVFLYLYLYFIINQYKKIKSIELVLLCIVSITTFSRGNIIVFLVILLLYLFKTNWKKTIISLSIIIAFMSILVIKNSNRMNVESINNYISTFSILSENNAISQRKEFSEYSIEKFNQNPLIGKGVGSLTARGTIERNIRIGNVKYDVVTDAFLYSILGEMGIIGLILFILSLLNLIAIRRNIYSYLMMFLFSIHLAGTDIPDFFMPYFIVLYMLNISKYNNIKTYGFAR